MRLTSCLAVAFVLSAVATPAQRPLGTIRGRVDVRVERSVRDARPDPSGLGMTHGRDPGERRSSVVYLQSAPRAAFEPDEDRRARLNQRDERFVPHVLAVTAGTWVDFPNSDATYHNVFSLSKGNEFNLGRYASGRSRAFRFDRPGIVRVFCEIHSHMSAFILVFSHRYFAVTDDDGRYRIDNVPPGTYPVVAWHEALPSDTRRVSVPETGDVDLNFVLSKR